MATKKPTPEPAPSTAMVVFDPAALEVQTKAYKGLQWEQDATPEQKLMIARVAIQLNLNPIAGHLTLYQGKPYITIDGRIHLALSDGNYIGLKEDRPMTPQEYTLHKLDFNSNMGWYVEVQRRDWPNVGRGWGRVRLTIDPRAEYQKFQETPAARLHPAVFARKRALHRALRETFQITNVEGVTEAASTEAQEAIDEATGIIDSPMITPGQITRIHVLKGQLGWHQEYYAAFLRSKWGVETSKDLSMFEAQDAIIELEVRLDLEKRQAAKAQAQTEEPTVEAPETASTEPPVEAPATNGNGGPVALLGDQQDSPRNKAIIQARVVSAEAKRLGLKVPGGLHKESTTDEINTWSSDLTDLIVATREGQ